MLGKNNQQIKLEKCQEQNKHERFGIRKLTVGTACVLLGFGFLVNTKQETAKADTTTDNSDAIKMNSSTAKISDSSTKLTTFSGLKSFLNTKISPEKVVAAKEGSVLRNDSEIVSSSDVSEENVNLDNAAKNLQDKVSQGQNTVESSDFTKAKPADQDALTVAVGTGKNLLDQYQNLPVDEVNDPNLDEINKAGTPIVTSLHMASDQIAQALIPLTSQIGPQDEHVWDDGNCVLTYLPGSHTLTMAKTNDGNALASGSTADLIGDYATQVQKIVVQDDLVLDPDASYLFSNLDSLTEITGLNKLDTSQVTDMANMFANDTNLETLDLSSFNTSKVTNMANMFLSDKKLKTLDLSSFDTSQVTNMAYMISSDTSLEEVKVSSFNTSQVTNMTGMFYFDTSLKNLNLTNFDTSQVTSMAHMFSTDKSLETLDITSFKTSQVTDMIEMFYRTSSLKSLDLTNFDTSGLIPGVFTDHSVGSTTRNGSAARMFRYMGDENHFVLTLGHHPYALGVDGTNILDNSLLASIRHYVRPLGNGDDSDPTGEIATGKKAYMDLRTLYLPGASQPVETYLLANTPDKLRYSVENASLKVHAGQEKFGLPDIGFNNEADLLDDTVYSLEDLMHTTDTILPRYQTITKAEWIKGKVIVANGGNSALVSGGMLKADGTIDYGQVPSIPGQVGNSLVKISFGDGTTGYVPVTISVVDPVAAENKTVNSGVPVSQEPASFIANQADLADFNPRYEFSTSTGQPLATSPIPQWYPHEDHGNIYVKVSYPDGNFKVVPVNVTIIPQPGKLTVNHYLLNTTTPVPGKEKQNPSGYVHDYVDVDAGIDPNGYNLVGPNHQHVLLNQATGQSTAFYYQGKPVNITTSYELKNGNEILPTSTLPSLHARVGDTLTITPDPASVPQGYALLTNEPQTVELSYDKIDPDNEHTHDESYTYQVIFKVAVIKPITMTLTVFQNDILAVDPKHPETNAEDNSYAKAAIINYNSLSKVFAAGWRDGTPNTSQLGTVTTYARIHTRDANLGSTRDGQGNYYLDVPVTIKVIPKPGLTMADIYHPNGISINVPQYTDIPQDMTYAQQAISNSADMPEGTTYAWEKHAGQFPDTSKAGVKRQGFVRVSFPDGSYKSVKVPVIVADKITKDITLKHNAYLYNAAGKRANGITLDTGSIVTTYGTKVINGRKFYLLDDENYFLAVGNDQAVSRKLDHNAYLYDVQGQRVNNKHIVNKGASVKTYGAPVLINGKEYYAVGNGEYLKKNNFPPTPKWLEPEISAHALATDHSKKRLVHNSYLYDEDGKLANQIILKSGSILETTGIKIIDNQTYYELDNGLYVKADDFA